MKLIACQFYISDLGDSTATNNKSSEYAEYLKMSTFRDSLHAWKQFLLEKHSMRLFELWAVLLELHEKLCWNND